ncbi:MAG: rhodanese-like domain-containing protein [Bacteroidales bacterium]
MKFKSGIYTLLFSLLAFSIMSCGNSGKGKKTVDATPIPTPVIGQETSLLLKDLEENGDYVNSQYFPSLIKASVVFEELEKNNLIIDLRTPESFRKGHIRGAVSKNFSDLPDYFETGIRPFEYDRIIMVCDDGQISSYTTALLRMMGYGNVFALRWGMGGWNRTYAQDGWMKGVSGKYEGRLETVATEAAGPTGMPELKTGLATGKEISDARFGKLFEEGTGEIFVTADEIFSDPGKYFVINLERKDKYDNAHIPGAVRYKPESTLGFPEVMATIPSDKTVVVYCGTGHNSAFATAFLRLFGYDARTLRYGNNSFMYDKMIKDRTALSWLPFTLSESNDYPVVK